MRVDGRAQMILDQPDRRELRQPTAQYVAAIVLAADDSELVTLLATAALTAISQRDAERAAKHVALEHWHTAETRVERQREIIRELRARLRVELRPAA
jgi:flagellin-specific chaperone FliS